MAFPVAACLAGRTVLIVTRDVVVMDGELSIRKRHFRRIIGAVHMHKNMVDVGEAAASGAGLDGIARFIRHLEGEVEQLTVI